MNKSCTVSYRNMRSDYSTELEFGSKSAAIEWARKFVAASYRNEAAAIVNDGDGQVCRFDNINGRAVRGQ